MRRTGQFAALVVFAVVYGLGVLFLLALLP